MPWSYYFFETALWTAIFFGAGFILWMWKWEHGTMITKIILSILIFLSLIVIIYGSFIEPQKLVIKDVELTAKVEKELRVGLVSDIHVGPYKKQSFVQKIVDTLQEQNPDIILIAGDFLYGDGRFISELTPLKQIKVPTYFVLGNHDYRLNGKMIKKEVSLLKRMLEEWGLKDITNASIPLSKDIWLIGTDDSYWGNIDLKKAFQNVPENVFTFFMAHSPDIMVDLEREGILPNLTVTGHTHGGQIRFPIIGDIPFILPLRDKRFEKGWYSSHNIYVSSGAGESGTRARLLNPPEIVMISIKSQDK